MASNGAVPRTQRGPLAARRRQGRRPILAIPFRRA